MMKRKNIVGQIFRTAAAPLARDKGEMGEYYRRIRARSGSLQANVATAHKLATIFFVMVKTKTEYDASKVGLSERELTSRKTVNREEQFGYGFQTHCRNAINWVNQAFIGRNRVQ